MKKKQILIVEDERIEADNVKASLQKIGYDVCGIAVSGEEAIQKAEEMHPDLVLMDLVLKGEAENVLAALKICSIFNIPIVYFSTDENSKKLEGTRIPEPFCYILRPFEDRDVHSTIDVALHQHKIRNNLEETEKKYQSVVENAHDAIYMMTPKRLQYVNPAFEKLSGYKKSELCSDKFDFWNIIHPNDVKRIEKNSKNMGKNGIRNKEFRIVTKNKEVKIVKANTVNIGINKEVVEVGILKDITKHKNTEFELKEIVEKLQRTFEMTINALVTAVETRDPYTAGHQKRVTDLACAIANEMGLAKDKIEGVRLAGTIHDIGKIQIPYEILTKPTSLSKIESVMIKMHPQVGYDILKEIEFPSPVAQIILQHHEKIDGSGYPAGLSGDEILIEARIIAVADIIEAMSSHRPYRPALGIDAALNEAIKFKGIFYEPEVVDACLKLFREKKYTLK
jgi:PAS domain S-box-containing protein/putative nucleotidyltransferase with HDIG domain